MKVPRVFITNLEGNHRPFSYRSASFNEEGTLPGEMHYATQFFRGSIIGYVQNSPPGVSGALAAGGSDATGDQCGDWRKRTGRSRCLTEEQACRTVAWKS